MNYEEFDLPMRLVLWIHNKLLSRYSPAGTAFRIGLVVSWFCYLLYLVIWLSILLAIFLSIHQFIWS